MSVSPSRKHFRNCLILGTADWMKSTVSISSWEHLIGTKTSFMSASPFREILFSLTPKSFSPCFLYTFDSWKWGSFYLCFSFSSFFTSSYFCASMAIKLIPPPVAGYFAGVCFFPPRFESGGYSGSSSSDTTGDIGLSSGEFVFLT